MTSVASWHAKDVIASREGQLHYLDLVQALFSEVNPIPVKAAMNMMGMQVGGYRYPLCEMMPGYICAAAQGHGGLWLMRVIVIGRGKMGTLLSESAAAHGHEVIAMADAANQDEVKPLDCDAVIDFSHPDNLEWVCAYVRARHCVLICGTTGLNDAQKQLLQQTAQACRYSILPTSLMASPCWRRCWRCSPRC